MTVNVPIFAILFCQFFFVYFKIIFFKIILLGVYLELLYFPGKFNLFFYTVILFIASYGFALNYMLVILIA